MERLFARAGGGRETCGGEDFRFGDREVEEGGEDSREDRGGVVEDWGMEVDALGGVGGCKGRASSEGSTSDAAVPRVGFLPSRMALEMSAAFHFAYLILASVASESSDRGKTLRTSKKLEAARNFFAVDLVAFPPLSSSSAILKTLSAKFST